MIKGLFETDIVSVTPDQPVSQVVELMRGHKIGDVIVVADDVPVGIVTDRDIALKVFSGNFAGVDRLTVADVMSDGIVTVKDTEYLLDVIDKMKDTGVVRLPVVNAQGKLCGVITDLHCMQCLTDALEKVTHISQKDADESTPPAMTTDRKNESARPSIQ